MENRSSAAETMCPMRGPLEMTFRLGKMEASGDFAKLFHWNNQDKCLARGDQRANEHFLPGVLTSMREKA